MPETAAHPRGLRLEKQAAIAGLAVRAETAALLLDEIEKGTYHAPDYQVVWRAGSRTLVMRG